MSYFKRLLYRVTSLILVMMLFFSMANPFVFAKNELTKTTSGVIQNNFKRQWTDDEIRSLGYMPGEVLIKFKKDQIDLQKPSDKQKVHDFIAKNSEYTAEKTLQKMRSKKSKLEQKFDEFDNQEKTNFKKNFLKLKQNLDFANLSVVDLGIDESVEGVIEALRTNPEIEYVVPNYTFSLSSATPNDLYYSSQWALENTAQILIGSGTYINNNPVSYTATTDADIDISEAWSEVSGTGKVVVAVLDTGVNYNHSDLNANMWNDNGICYGTGGTSIDDLIDGGCPNHGWDFVNGDSEPMDDNRHGTNIAGIIGGEQNYLGVAGMTENVELMAVKIATSTGYLVNLINGVQFAQNNGAKIINASIALDNPDAEKEVTEIAFNNFIANGGLVVAGAGNNYHDNDTSPIYPSSFESDGLISVAATDQNDEIAYFENWWGSNWGENSVDVAAPGVNILTTDLDGDYYYAWGTSMATPHVAGLAAMIWAERPDFTALQVKQRIMDTVDDIGDLDPDTGTHPIKSGGRINAYNALHGLHTYIPPLQLTPTIHAKSTGGNWNSYSTWVENNGLDCSEDECRLPNASDIVEVNGMVTMTSSGTVAGLLINSGATLRDYTSDYTNHNNNLQLTINGDLLNNGTILNYSSNSGYPYWREYYQDFTLNINGDIANNGIIQENGNSDFTLNLGGDIKGIGNWNPTNTNLLSDSIVSGSGTLKGHLDTWAKTFTVMNSRILTLEDVVGNAKIDGTGMLKINRDFSGDLEGNIAQTEIINGGNLDGKLNLPVIYFTGTGTRYLINDTVLGGDVTVGTNIILKDYTNNYTNHTINRQLTINGTLTNNGTISNYSFNSGYPYWREYYQDFTLNINGDIANNGIIQENGDSDFTLNISGNTKNSVNWASTLTNLTWSAVSGATAYNFQMTNDNNAWQTPETLTGTSKLIANTYFNPNKGYRWRTRALVNGVYTDWSTTKKINEYKTSQLITSSGGTVILTNQNALVEFPENATNQDLNINITELDDTGELPATELAYSLITTAYEFTAANLQGASVTTFDDDVIIMLHYDPLNLGNIQESTLKVNYYDEVTEVWVALPSVVDTVNHTVTAQSNHFTKYAVLGAFPIPSAPEDFYINQNNLTFGWDAVASVPEAPLQGYKLYYSIDGGVSWVNFGQTSGTQYPLPLADPFGFSGFTVAFAVTALNASGESEKSDVVYFLYEEDLPPPPPPPLDEPPLFEPPMCGLSAGGSFSEVPIVDLCFVGTASVVTNDFNGSWIWTCTNDVGQDYCSAIDSTYEPLPPPPNEDPPPFLESAGVCGVASGTSFEFTPSDLELCSAGMLHSFTRSDGMWWWECIGSISTASCSAIDTTPVGVCGIANGGEFGFIPDELELCEVGPVSGVIDMGETWYWECGIELAFCSAINTGEPPPPPPPLDEPPLPEPPMCGLSAESWFSEEPTVDLCFVGTASVVTNDSNGNWVWSCTNETGSENCNAFDINAIPQPICGSAVGGTFSEAPTEDLCAVGDFLEVGNDLNGSWVWDCETPIASEHCSAVDSNYVPAPPPPD